MRTKLDVKAPPASSVTCTQAKRRHRITPEAGHALEKLAHAIEYLTDELVDKDPTMSSDNERVQAIQILMALNRQVYFECPLELTVCEWLRAHLPRLNLLAGKNPDREHQSDVRVIQSGKPHHPHV
ncbi:MAG: hypothetical protein P4K86_01810 [Terracidiphilus sp.]|nr:hypothetical protein [Terracidiphilus sp.]